MKIYWTANSVPELKGLDKKEQNKKMREIQKVGREVLGAQLWIRVAIALVIAIVIAVVAYFLLGNSGPVRFAIYGLVGGFAMILGYQQPVMDAGLEEMRKNGKL